MTPDNSGERVLATILFIDIVGSTATLAKVADSRWRRLVLATAPGSGWNSNNDRGKELAMTGDRFHAPNSRVAS